VLLGLRRIDLEAHSPHNSARDDEIELVEQSDTSTKKKPAHQGVQAFNQ
jgi:hypothetical protein